MEAWMPDIGRGILGELSSEERSRIETEAKAFADKILPFLPVMYFDDFGRIRYRYAADEKETI